MLKISDFLCFQIGLAARKLQRYYNAAYAKYGITVTQSYILFSLYVENGQNIKTLAERLSLESPAVTGLVDRLEKEGMVERKDDPDDRRALRIFLTAKGKDLVEKIIPEAISLNEQIKSFFSEEEKKALNKVFECIDGKLLD